MTDIKLTKEGRADRRQFNRGRKPLNIPDEERQARRLEHNRQSNARCQEVVCDKIKTKRSRAERIREAKNKSGLSWVKIICRGLDIEF